jgi:hypothetical protein
MKKVFSVLLASAALASISMAATGSWEGWVSDDRCGAKVDPVCSKTCLQQGAKIVFVTTDKAVIKVTNPSVLKDHVGQHVRVKGDMDKGEGTLTISSVEPIKDK